jgi:hypothetical protein
VSRRREWRGDHRVRVGLRIGATSADMDSMWPLDGPGVQRPSLAGRYVVRVDVGGKLALLQSFDDPGLNRAIAPEGQVGHSYTAREPATVLVDVPLQSGVAVSGVSIRVADLSQVRKRPTDPAAVARLFDKPPPGMRLLPSILLDQLTDHPDWAAVAAALGPS